MLFLLFIYSYFLLIIHHFSRETGCKIRFYRYCLLFSAMHNEAFAYLGLDYAYLAFEVDNSTLEDAVKGIRALKLVVSSGE